MPIIDINIYTLKQVRTKRRRYNLEGCKITCPLACYKTVQKILDLNSEPVEKFGIIALNTKNEINGIHIIGSGTINNVNIEPREVYMAALMNNAKSIIAFHNHRRSVSKYDGYLDDSKIESGWGDSWDYVNRSYNYRG